MNEMFCKRLLEYRNRTGYSQKDISEKLLIEELLMLRCGG